MNKGRHSEVNQNTHVLRAHRLLQNDFSALCYLSIFIPTVALHVRAGSALQLNSTRVHQIPSVYKAGGQEEPRLGLHHKGAQIQH